MMARGAVSEWIGMAKSRQRRLEEKGHGQESPWEKTGGRDMGAPGNKFHFYFRFCS